MDQGNVKFDHGQLVRRLIMSAKQRQDTKLNERRQQLLYKRVQQGLLNRTMEAGSQGDCDVVRLDEEVQSSSSQLGTMDASDDAEDEDEATCIASDDDEDKATPQGIHRRGGNGNGNGKRKRGVTQIKQQMCAPHPHVTFPPFHVRNLECVN